MGILENVGECGKVAIGKTAPDVSLFFSANDPPSKTKLAMGDSKRNGKNVSIMKNEK
jgi:hypothetical protein